MLVHRFFPGTALSSASERTTSNPKTPSSFLSYAPRDASEGLAEGLKSIALGVGAGVAGLVAMPVVGAREKGVSGFFKGLGQGVLGAVVLPTVGVVNGVVEIGAGIVNTPEVRDTKAVGNFDFFVPAAPSYPTAGGEVDSAFFMRELPSFLCAEGLKTVLDRREEGAD